ncbi:MAG TPA: AI-2E family transporter [Candidatus Limnocylindrales bacterium]|nr:AI-2E family transporter [Candidatus Limnocylindrales bacterium]
MNDGANTSGSFDLRAIAAATAVVIAMVAVAAVAYELLDVLLMMFVGVVVAAALQPWHGALCRRGIPKGLAVLLLYVFLLLALTLVAFAVGPMLFDQLGTFAAALPENYGKARAHLQGSGTGLFRFIAARLPPFERLAPALTDLAPQLVAGTLGVTTSIVKIPVYFVSVLAIAFYWTLELPRFERVVVSMIPVESRPRALNIWHEIELRLGGFLRGQGLAMFFIGVASAAGYALIGLPNVLALGVLAGLLEAVPLIGPLLAVAPALLVALPLGGHSVPFVIAFAVLLHLVESNVLIPRIMHRTVGVSALVSLVAILSFGTLYGIAGVFVAIPMAAVIQALLDTLFVNADVQPTGAIDDPTDDLRVHVRSIGQQARSRLRGRTSRMGIDPASADHVVDAVDQQIEAAVKRVETLIAADDAPGAPATQRLEEAVQEVETLNVAAHDAEQETSAAKP